MGLWTTLVNGVESVSNGVAQGVSWTWNNASLSGMASGLFSYSTNTAFGILEQGLALKKAIPSFINHPKSLKIAKGIVHVAWDAVPVLGLNYLNNATQNYFRSDVEQETSWLTTYSVFLTGLTLVDYGVRAYSLRQGVQSLMQVSVLDTLGPAAFTSQKKLPSFSPCVEEQCNTSRRLKGWLREPFILLGNDLLTGAIQRIPYVGASTAYVAKILFNGRYISRLSSPELCERHKAQFIMHEYVLGLGLVYELTTMFMDKALESTIGIPPYLYYRSLHHLLLLLHVNVAAHMAIPLVQPKDATLLFDPLNFFERISRFTTDVVMSGLKVRVPIDFKPEKDAEPFIPLSSALQFATKMLELDLNKKHVVELTHYQKSVNGLWTLALPPLMHSVDHFVNDPILALYWPGLRKDVLSYIHWLHSKGYMADKFALAQYPGFMAFSLYYLFNVQNSWTKTILMLSEEKDLWELTYALKAWFERHHKNSEMKLPEQTTTTPLRGETRDESISELIDSNTASLPVKSIDINELMPPKNEASHMNFNELRSRKNAPVEVNLSDFKVRNNRQSHLNNVGLFTAKRKPINEGLEEVALSKKII